MEQNILKRKEGKDEETITKKLKLICSYPECETKKMTDQEKKTMNYLKPCHGCDRVFCEKHYQEIMELWETCTFCVNQY